MSEFMQKQVECGSWYLVEGDNGTECVPADLVGEITECAACDVERKEGQTVRWVFDPAADVPTELSDYVETRRVFSIERRKGWGARLSAPGYLDCTEWSVFDTEQEANDYLAEQYDDDSATNLDCLSDDPCDLEAFSNDTSKPQPLRDYAALKAKAMRARLAGRIQEALGFEGNCDEIYSKLPTDLRW